MRYAATNTETTTATTLPARGLARHTPATMTAANTTPIKDVRMAARVV
jgi:hypothetical protein